MFAWMEKSSEWFKIILRRIIGYIGVKFTSVWNAGTMCEYSLLSSCRDWRRDRLRGSNLQDCVARAAKLIIALINILRHKVVGGVSTASSLYRVAPRLSCMSLLFGCWSVTYFLKSALKLLITYFPNNIVIRRVIFIR